MQCEHIHLINLKELSCDIEGLLPELIESILNSNNSESYLISLDVHCSITKRGVKDRILVGDSIEEVYNENRGIHDLVLCFETLEIYCLTCDWEIGDEFVLRMFDSKEKLIVTLRREIVRIVEDFYEAHFSIVC